MKEYRKPTVKSMSMGQGLMTQFSQPTSDVPVVDDGREMDARKHDFVDEEATERSAWE